MLKLLETSEDVIAVRLSEKITGADLDSVMDRVEQAMSAGGKVHVYVETRSIDGIEISSLPKHMGRAMPMFGKLDRFGRVAVVADQAWMRVATRLESALLPNISYRIYMPDERDEALAWVLGSETVA